MKLQDFVSETLQQIIRGIKDAQEKTKDSGAEVSPALGAWSGNLEKHKIIQAKSGHCVHFVDFDVALTVTQETETKAGIGIFASVIGIGAQGQTNNENATINRIQFRVPITLPQI